MNAYKIIWGQSNVVILFLDCEAGSHMLPTAWPGALKDLVDPILKREIEQ